jgi:hypothetical protein
MNYSVHASMYGYYFLMAMKMRPKWFNPIIITIFQISQMVVGVSVTLAGFYYYQTDPTCGIQNENNTAAFVMYGSYLFLFLQFFFGRYFKKKGGKKQKSVWTNKTWRDEGKKGKWKIYYDDWFIRYTNLWYVKKWYLLFMYCGGCFGENWLQYSILWWWCLGK